MLISLHTVCVVSHYKASVEELEPNHMAYQSKNI